MQGQYFTSEASNLPHGTQQVYAPGFKAVLNVPSKEIRHLPPASLNVTRLVLCANYDPQNPETSCPMGARCKFVHADATCASQHEIHVNYAWRSLDEVAYERYPPGEILQVAPPNSKAAGDVMDSQLALKTKALQSHRRPLSHCAHYYFNRTCNLGPECRFIHAVFIDPNAKEHQRAPAPAQLGREHHHHQYRQQRAAIHGMGDEPSQFEAGKDWSPNYADAHVAPQSSDSTNDRYGQCESPSDAKHDPYAVVAASG
jgi:hypothetical protein